MTKKTIELKFKLADATIETIEATVGQNVMRTAIFNNIEGIDAECGGSCMCATCHVYISEEIAKCIPPASDNENVMLDETAAERRPHSRLSCQLIVAEEMDGCVIEVPECQS